MDAIYTEDAGMGVLIEIHYDDSGINPRKEWDCNFGTIVHWHPRYDLGEVQWNRDNVTREAIEDYLAEQKAYAWLPLYLLDHSGITISTSDFRDPWDSGQVGFIFTTKEKLVAAGHNPKKLPSVAQVEEWLDGEVQTFDDFLTGNVYGYVIRDVETDEVLDACWGFYPDHDESKYEPDYTYCLTEARSSAEYYVRQKNEANTAAIIDAMKRMAGV
jgi:hypothetical protein